MRNWGGYGQSHGEAPPPPWGSGEAGRFKARKKDEWGVTARLRKDTCARLQVTASVPDPSVWHSGFGGYRPGVKPPPSMSKMAVKPSEPQRPAVSGGEVVLTQVKSSGLQPARAGPSPAGLLYSGRGEGVEETAILLRKLHCNVPTEREAEASSAAGSLLQGPLVFPH